MGALAVHELQEAPPLGYHRDGDEGHLRVEARSCDPVLRLSLKEADRSDLVLQPERLHVVVVVDQGPREEVVDLKLAPFEANNQELQQVVSVGELGFLGEL